MIFVLPFPPSSNRYWRIWRGRAVVSTEARQYKNGVRLRLLSDGYRKPLAGPVVLTASFYRPRRVGDTDNMLKVLQDALNGVAWEDDSQVTEIHAYRMDDKENPRVVVRVEEAKP